MQSNLAIAEELLRISQYLEPDWPSCLNLLCGFYGLSGTSVSENYVRFGVNAHGTPRYRCNACQKVFAHGGKATKQQRRTSINKDIFEHLVNTVPIRRIIKLYQISPDTLYEKLDFIYRQCSLFAGARERSLVEMENLGKRYITTDRQKIMVNWSSRKDRRNTVLLSIASADLTTGYVFAVNLNYDPALDAEQIERDAHTYGDYHLNRAFRRYARVWLPNDFDVAADVAQKEREERVRKSAASSSMPAAPTLTDTIEAIYANAAARDDVEQGDAPSATARTPAKGMLLHETVVMNAHIQLVSRLLQRAPKIRFFMDQESGLRAAFMAALPGRILNRTADAFYVQVSKDETIDEKRRLISLSTRRFAATKKDFPELSDDEIQVLLARQELARIASIGQWGDRWLIHPIPDMREPEKRICWLTDIDSVEGEKVKRNEQLDHFARLYLKASLTSVDRFFMQVRRAITMAERGVISASADRRLWFGKNAYNPHNLSRLMEVFRTYFNYCEIGDDKKTPAMRLGLAKGPISPEDILYFVPEPQPRQRSGPLRRPSKAAKVN